jgi:hypothetical protein
MSTAMTAQDISQEWLSFVTETFMLENGCISQETQEEYKRIESADEFTKYREMWRTYTDDLIDNILRSTGETRLQLLSTTDIRSLAYVQDRILCGTELLTAMVRKGLQINLEETSSLPDFFRQVLLQK